MIEWFQKFWISVFIVVLETRAKGALAALEFRADDRAAMDFLKKRRQVESQSQGWSLTRSAPRTKLLQFQGWIRTDRWLVNLYNAAAPGEGTCWCEEHLNNMLMETSMECGRMEEKARVWGGEERSAEVGTVYFRMLMWAEWIILYRFLQVIFSLDVNHLSRSQRFWRCKPQTVFSSCMPLVKDNFLF